MATNEFLLSWTNLTILWVLEADTFPLAKLAPGVLSNWQEIQAIYWSC